MSMLGKRKRRSEIAADRQSSSGDSDDDAAAKALFQRAFEAKFKPLPQDLKPSKVVEVADEEGSSSGDSDAWDGISEDAEDQVEVIRVDDAPQNGDHLSRSREMKAFMSSKIPSARPPPPRPQEVKTEDDDTEKANLKNDLALQRLLKESHLLDASTYNTTGSEAQGKKRLWALDLRMQELGAKKSHLAQVNMPQAHRKSMLTKKSTSEQKRRKEAAENGIILERAKFEKKRSSRPRDIGLGDPTVGRFKGGMLKLSGKDLCGMEGPRSSSRGGKRRGRGG